MNNQDPEKLEELKKLTEDKDTKDERVLLDGYKLPTAIDGYRFVENENLPFKGKFYPQSWRFAYRCPTSLEVANFSTISEDDQPAIISAVEELIKKCFIIVDSESEQQISTEKINDGERLFFFLLLREFYLYDIPISYVVMNAMYKEPVTLDLKASMLVFPEPNQKLLDCYDGRKFRLNVNEETSISFLIPTLNTSAKVFRYMLKTYKDIQKEDAKIKNEDFDKQFLLFAPYLYEEGNETMEFLKTKFKKIQNDKVLYQGYLNLISNIKLTNLEKVVYKYKESEEEALIKFPGGWKSMFINKSAFGGVFE